MNSKGFDVTTDRFLIVSLLFIFILSASAVDLRSEWNGEFNGTSVDRAGNSGNLGIGHGNGDSADSLQVYYRFDQKPKEIVVGEAGTFNNSDGNWINVTFQENYTNPVVVGTSNTHNGEAALVFEARNVKPHSAEMRLCESEGGTNNGCDTHPEEKAGYLVIDASKTDQLAGIEAGKFSQDAEIDTDTSTITYSEQFQTTPHVFTSVQTVDGEKPIESRVIDYTQTDFTAGICHTDSTDACKSDHVSEEVGWVALEPGNLPFSQKSETNLLTGIENSAWTSDTFSNSFSQSPVVIAENPTDEGGQEVQIDEARNITKTGLQARYCEIDPTDTCNDHTGEEVAWLAIKPGKLSKSKLKDYSGNERNASRIGATRASIGILSTASYTFDGTNDYIFLEPYTYFENEINSKSYSLWFNANEVNKPQILFEEGGSVNGLNIYINNSKLYYGAYSETNNYQGDWISTNINKDQWYHATLTFNSSNMSAYLDSNYVGSVNPGATISSHSGDSAIASMKTDTKTKSDNQTGDGFYFNGSIDEFRSFNEVLNKNQIIKEYFYNMDGFFKGTYSSEVKNKLEKKQWDSIEINASIPSNTKISGIFKTINNNDEAENIKKLDINDGYQTIDFKGLNYTKKYRLNFTGNSSDSTKTWRINSFKVNSNTVPSKPKSELITPDNDTTPQNNVSFNFKPLCYSDQGCTKSQLFFNFTENKTDSIQVNTSQEWREGTLDNISEEEGNISLEAKSFYETGNAAGVNDWTEINLQGTYDDPIVVATGQEGADKSSDVEASRPVLTNITENSFTVKVVNDKEQTVTEDLGYIVMEKGHHTIDGVEVEAGNYTITQKQLENTADQTVNYQETFPTNTVFVDSLQSSCGGRPVSSRYSGGTGGTSSFQTAWEDFFGSTESAYSCSNDEAGYIAVEQGASNTEFESGVITGCNADPDNGNWCTATFSNTYSTPPILLTNPIGESGTDTTVVGRQNLTKSNVDLRATESRVPDTEQGHAASDIPWIVWKNKDAGYKPDGTYQSKLFEASKPVYWNQSTIKSFEPTNTNIDIKYGENSSGSFQYHDSLSKLTQSKYFQFKAELNTTEPSKTPKINTVNITYLRPEKWNKRKTLNTVTNNTEETIEFNFSKILELPSEIYWNIKTFQSDTRTGFGPANRTIRIAKTNPEPPKWRNQTQSKSGSIPQSGSNTLKAQGFDAVRLANATLATNETGSFENKTGDYGSPMTLNTDAKWTWTNFTWVNSSISGQNIAWKIYYQDTNNQINSTDVKTFYVTNTDTAPPIIQIIEPENTSFNNQNVPLKTEASEEIDTWKYNLDSNGNQTFTPNTTLNNLNEGSHSITVYANDTSGNNGSKSRQFEVDLTKPQILNLEDNATGEFFQSDSANLSVKAKDSISGVTNVKLATNETGTFQNKSTYGSPKTYENISGKEITSSFNWMNKSFSGRLGYKFYVKDAAGNWKETSTQEFKVKKLNNYLFARLNGKDWQKGTRTSMRESSGDLVIGYDKSDPNLKEFYTFEQERNKLKSIRDGINTETHGTITTQATGIFNSETYSFDGTDDYIGINRSYKNTGGIDELTICTWAKSSTSKSQIILSYDRSEVFRFSLSSDQLNSASGYIGWHTSGENNANQDMIGNTVVTDGNWHNICAVYDNSDTNDKKIYVDGNLDAEQDQHDMGEGLGTGLERYGFIGTGSEASSFDGTTGPDLFLEGKMDSLRVYEKALSQNRIEEQAKLDPALEGNYQRDFNVPGYQNPQNLEADSKGLNPDTDLKYTLSNSKNAELFDDSVNGIKNYSLTLGEANQINLTINSSTEVLTNSPITEKLSIFVRAKTYDQKIKPQDGTNSLIDNTKVIFYNRYNDKLKEKTLKNTETSILDKIPRNENYTFSVDTPFSYAKSKLNVTQIKSNNSHTVNPIFISNYTGIKPADYKVDPVTALNTENISFKNAKLVLPYTEGQLDKIIHCTNWDFQQSECSSQSAWEVKNPSFYNPDKNGTHVKFNVTTFDAYGTAKKDGPNFAVENVSLNNTQPISGQQVNITSNVSNNRSTSEDNLTVELQIETFNGTKWNTKKTEENYISLSGNSNKITNFTWEAKPGRYRFNVTADPENNITETKETDNSNQTELNLSSYETFYGGNNAEIELSDINNKSIYFYGEGYENSTLYFIDKDMNFEPSKLRPINGSNDLSEADQALNLTGHNDSITKLYDENNDGNADHTRCMEIAGNQKCQIPVINSTNTENFKTGITYQSDFNNEYNGSQKIIFLTETNKSKTGKQGVYDYEIKVPFSLEKQIASTELVQVVAEIN